MMRITYGKRGFMLLAICFNRMLEYLPASTAAAEMFREKVWAIGSAMFDL